MEECEPGRYLMGRLLPLTPRRLDTSVHHLPSSQQIPHAGKTYPKQLFVTTTASIHHRHFLNHQHSFLYHHHILTITQKPSLITFTASHHNKHLTNHPQSFTTPQNLASSPPQPYHLLDKLSPTTEYQSQHRRLTNHVNSLRKLQILRQPRPQSQHATETSPAVSAKFSHTMTERQVALSDSSCYKIFTHCPHNHSAHEKFDSSHQQPLHFLMYVETPQKRTAPHLHINKTTDIYHTSKNPKHYLHETHSTSAEPHSHEGEEAEEEEEEKEEVEQEEEEEEKVEEEEEELKSKTTENKILREEEEEQEEEKMKEQEKKREKEEKEARKQERRKGNKSERKRGEKEEEERVRVNKR
ncbi:hypothetical protein E2C01_028679 [Portunus trituberculatus]|uniref:Uncharacterized protein n=1 Tax=Portunus trituberculatus TaxID=210409 RepID=A0A5B7EL34_PORTR|nr:hypothetical protein [Portunus trituberculatus]